MVRLPRNDKQTHRLNSRLQMGPSGLTLAMTLTLNYEGQISNWLYLTKKMVRLPRNEKQTHRLKSRLQMGSSGLTLAMTLTLNFQGQISNWIYLSKKWCDCHEMKSKHIDWSQDLKCDHQVWPWPWPWPWIFKVKYRIGYISAKKCAITTRQKRTHRLNFRPQMWPSVLTLALTLTLNFQGQISNWLYLCKKWTDCHGTKSEHIDWTLGLKCNHKIWPWPWPWPWIFKVKYEICYISTKSCPIATRRKANISIWSFRPQIWQWVWPWPWPWYLNFQGHMWSWPFGDQGQV